MTFSVRVARVLQPSLSRSHMSTMPRRSFPPPPPPSSTSPPVEPSIPRTPLLSLLPPPPPSGPSTPLRPLPSASTLPGYIHTTHLLPSAYPRTFRDSTSPPAAKRAANLWLPVDPSSESRAQRMSRVKSQIEHLSQINDEGSAVRNQEGERVGVRMEQVVERFVRSEGGTSGKKELTLVLGHANGLPVEDWHLPLRTAINYLSSQGSLPFEIAEIWLLNTPLTHPAAGPAYTWTDHARDYTNFVLHYLPLSPCSTSLPQVLERRDAPERREGIVSVGHSFSATSFLLAELEHARKASSSMSEALMLIDPMIMDPRTDYFQVAQSIPGKPSALTRGAVGRPDIWPTLSAVKPTLLKSLFFQAFHSTQLDSYIEHGFTLLNPSDPDDLRVTLAFPRWAEALIFSGGRLLGEVWDRMECGGERVGKGCKEVRWVFPGVGNLSGSDDSHQRIAHFLSSPPPSTADSSLRGVPAKSTNIIIDGAGHLVVQERPIEMGEALAEFLTEVFDASSTGLRAKL